MVFYRKYRPQTIDELDLEEVRNRLKSLLSGSNIPHAFLFSGPKGLGKTSAARILAREVHGETLPKDTVSLIAAGSHPDVLEIDAASNRGIDEIRELRSRIQYSPAELPKKIYIIDEVHMLTREAFNALLKTLEEPPEHVVFILATTEPWRLPATILSRTFNVEFREPETSEIVASLGRIVKGEKLEVEDGVLEEVAEMSEGAFRDAAKLFEELVIAAGGKKISLKILENVFRVGEQRALVRELYGLFGKRDLEGCMNVIGEIEKSGADFALVVEQLLSFVRENLSEAGNIELASRLMTAYSQIAVSPISALPLEIAAVEWCGSGSMNYESRIMDESKIKNLESQSAKKDKVTDDGSKEKNKDRGGEVIAEKIESGKSVSEDMLQRLIMEVDRENKMLAGVLRGLSVGKLSSSELELVAKSKFHHERVSEKKSVDLIEKVLHEITGDTVKVNVKMS